MPVTSCIPFPFAALCDDMLTMLVCATRWLPMHPYTLAYMFMHEFYLLVCRPCFNTMKLWTFNPNLHLSLMDTTFCLPFYLFVFFLVCLLACLFAFLHSCFFIYLMARHVSCHMLYLPCLSCLFSLCLFHMLYASFSFHCLCAGFLSLPLHVHTWSEGTVSQAQVKRARMRACGYKPSSNVQ